MINKVIVFVLLCFSTQLFCQDKTALANAYLEKAKLTLKLSDTLKSISYLKKAVQNFEEIKNAETYALLSELYFAKKEYNLAKNYMDSFFLTEKDKTTADYQKMILLFIDLEDILLTTNNSNKTLNKEEAKHKEKNKLKVGNTIKETYQLSKLYFKKKAYVFSRKNINKYFSLKPKAQSKAYNEMLELFIDIEEKEDSIKAKEQTDLRKSKTIEEVVLEDETLNNETLVNETEKDVEEENVSFMIIETVPVYPGCIGNKRELKNCFSKSIQKHFARKFNADLPNKLGLSAGRKKVIIQFLINKQGDVENIIVKGPHPKIEEEVSNVMLQLPKMKPGTQRGKTVGVKYSMPFTLIVEGSSKDKNK